MKYSGAAVVANVPKKDSKNRPPVNAGIVFAVETTMVPIMTPRQPMKIVCLRPRQSASQMNKAPAIWPICSTVSIRLIKSPRQPQRKGKVYLKDGENYTGPGISGLRQIIVTDVVG